MATVVLVIHLMLAAALVGVVLLQRSEGGALGIGGGGGPNVGRGSGNVLTKATAMLAAAFFVTSIVLTILAQGSGSGPSLIERLDQGQGAGAMTGEQPAGEGTGGGTILDKLKGSETGPAVPQSQ